MKADEKRLYQRVSFEVQAELKNDETALLCNVVDLSIHGALLKPTQAFDAAVGDSFELSIPYVLDGVYVTKHFLCSGCHLCSKINIFLCSGCHL